MQISLNELLNKEPEELRNIIKDEDVLNYAHALITLKVSKAPIKDFYIFNNVIHALNYNIPDFLNFEPCSSEELWNGLYIIHNILPDVKYDEEIMIYIKSTFGEDGIYFLPEFLDKKSYDTVRDRVESGPFPLGGDEKDLIGLQGAKLLALETYHNIESTKPIEII